MSLDISQSITSLPGIGPIIAKKLTKLRINTVFDLLYHLPFRYEDRSNISTISKLQPGETVTIIGTLSSLKNDYTHRGKFIQRGEISDSSGKIPIIWFNQPFLTRTLKSGQKVALYGKIDFFGRDKTLFSPEYEIGETLIHMGRIVPIYPETSGITSKWLRTRIFGLLDKLPTDFFDSQALPWSTAIQHIHFPQSLDQTQPARQRLAFDELFILQLISLRRRQNWLSTKLTHTLKADENLISKFIASLPFSLTKSQTIAINEILADISTNKPMNRLLEGDVGSGKTVVAAIAAYTAHLNKFQTLILAPTQILAQQHYQTLQTLFKNFEVNVDLITGNQKKLSSISHIIVGTHALLNSKFDRVGLVVIDEQHRFGVTQRALAALSGKSPHILTMTATPIPRTIALTLYGDLDLSRLTALPSGRLPIKTWVVPESKRKAAYDWIKRQSTQAFIVCPFIEVSESATTVKAATAEFEHLKQVFANSKLGLLHGKLKSSEKDEIMRKFKAQELDILVTTPVVEVGIDVPTATVMVIEAAERFGLAQLHQLRGRVGRSSAQSYCLLFSTTDQATNRLKALETHHSGIELAEIDLRLRGPGEVYGTTQHGLPQFKIATYSDLGLIQEAKTTALQVYPQLNHYPLLLKLLQDDKIELVQPN